MAAGVTIRDGTLVGAGAGAGAGTGGPAPGYVVMGGGVITGVAAGVPSGALRAGPALDASGLLVAPGFVDLQCNGAFGIDLSREPERLWELAALLPRFGVTAFLPTLVSSPAGIVRRALDSLGTRPDGFRGAEPLGLHLEGPMLNPLRRGAHDERHLRQPAADVVGGWTRRAGVAMVTLAPELPGALDAILALRRGGVTVAAGHTDATDAEMLAAVDAGVTAVTHLFNAMRPLGHRDVGVAGVALTETSLTVGMIVDGVHVHPRVVSIARTALGPARLALVTDSVAAAGTAFGGGAVRNGEGRLAGSLLGMDRAVRNLAAFTGCSIAEAVVSATATPARLLGEPLGRLECGGRADVVVLTPGGEVVATFAAGECVYGEVPAAVP